MKNRTLPSVFFLALALMLICLPLTLAADLSSSSKEITVQTGLSAAERTAQLVNNAHREIIQVNGIDLNQWIKFDLSDIPQMVEGKFPDVEKELALKFARTYYLGGTMKKYHKVGDMKPLLLLNQERKEVLVGLLHSDNTISMVKFNEADFDNFMFVDTVGTKRSYDIYGGCSISKALLGKVAAATVLNTDSDAKSDAYWAASNGWTLASEELDNLYISLGTYKDGVSQNFVSSFQYNTDYVEMDDVNGPAYSSAYWEVYSCHAGYNDGDPLLDKYHWNYAYLP